MEDMKHPMLSAAFEISGLTPEEVDSNPKLQKFIELINDALVKTTTDTVKNLEKLDVLLTATPCTISWIDKDLKYIGVNQMLATTCGLPPSEFVDKEIGFYTNNKGIYNFAKELFENDEKTIYKEITTTIDDKRRSFWIEATKFADESQGVMIGLDITDLKNLEEYVTFREKISSLGEMVAGILHEINNPLSAIDMSARVIQKKVENKEKVSDLARTINDMTTTITNIIKGVKNFVHHGDQEPFEVNYIKKILEESEMICKGRLIKYQIALNIDDFPSNIEFACNRTQVFQVFVNLINNACEALKEIDADEKSITISYEDAGDAHVLKFVDSGPGIPKDQRDKIFESFFTTKTKEGGTGMGLFLCKKIMQQHNGSIEATEQNGKTCFTLTFPKKAAA